MIYSRFVLKNAKARSEQGATVSHRGGTDHPGMDISSLNGPTDLRDRIRKIPLDVVVTEILMPLQRKYFAEESSKMARNPLKWIPPH